VSFLDAAKVSAGCERVFSSALGTRDSLLLIKTPCAITYLLLIAVITATEMARHRQDSFDIFIPELHF
jgi:hypothetical protein